MPVRKRCTICGADFDAHNLRIKACSKRCSMDLKNRRSTKQVKTANALDALVAEPVSVPVREVPTHLDVECDACGRVFYVPTSDIGTVSVCAACAADAEWQKAKRRYREKYWKDPERARERSREYYARNRERIADIRRARRENNDASRRKREPEPVTVPTADVEVRLLEAQGGVCGHQHCDADLSDGDYYLHDQRLLCAACA